MKKLSLFVATLALVLGGMAFGTPTAEAAIITPSQLQAGDLIRSESRSAVYYFSADGTRYVFVNSSTYFTWYDNFDNVRWLSDADMTTIQIGGNVTYKPTSRMIKIASDPKVYAVGTNGDLHWVTSEDVAVSLFGAEWNTMIDDLPDGFFSNYTLSSDINSTSDYNSASLAAQSPTIDADKDRRAPKTVSITSSGYSPEAVTVIAGQNVKWTNNDTVNHTVTADSLKWGSGTMAPGVTFIRRFDDDGTFTYFDSLNSSNTGAVFVE